MFAGDCGGVGYGAEMGIRLDMTCESEHHARGASAWTSLIHTL